MKKPSRQQPGSRHQGLAPSAGLACSYTVTRVRLHSRVPGYDIFYSVLLNFSFLSLSGAEIKSPQYQLLTLFWNWKIIQT